MTPTERRKAERDSMLYHYRAYQKVSEQSAPDESLVVIFTRPELAPKCFLLAFSGTAGKATAHYSYRTQQAAEQYAAEFLAGRNARRERMDQHRAERKAFRTSLKVGDVLDASWGYDQTNVDFYQVVDVSASGQSVTLRPIAARSVEDGWQQGVCWPLANEFTGEPAAHRVLPGDSVKVRDWGVYASKWAPRPVRWTAYA